MMPMANQSQGKPNPMQAAIARRLQAGKNKKKAAPAKKHSGKIPPQFATYLASKGTKQEQ